MAQLWAKKMYNSVKWQKCREFIFNKYFGVCDVCGKPGEEVHHIKHLTPTNINDPKIVYGEDNLQLLCRNCHFEKHRKTNPLDSNFKKKRLTNNGTYFDSTGKIHHIERWLVCGSPASGKTTYVKEHMLEGDMVVDLDLLGQAISMQPKAMLPYNLLDTVIKLREYLYKIISEQLIDTRNIWIIAALPIEEDRLAVAEKLNAKLVSIETSIEECIINAINDDERLDKNLQSRLIYKYFKDREKIAPP